MTFRINKGLSVGLLVAGIVLITWGINAGDSFRSDMSRFFNGSPSDKSIWMQISGGVLALAGLYGLFSGKKDD